MSDLFTKSGSIDVARQKLFKNAKNSVKVPQDNTGFCFESVKMATTRTILRQSQMMKKALFAGQVKPQMLVTARWGSGEPAPWNYVWRPESKLVNLTVLKIISKLHDLKQRFLRIVSLVGYV